MLVCLNNNSRYIQSSLKAMYSCDWTPKSVKGDLGATSWIIIYNITLFLHFSLSLPLWERWFYQKLMMKRVIDLGTVNGDRHIPSKPYIYYIYVEEKETDNTQHFHILIHTTFTLSQPLSLLHDFTNQSNPRNGSTNFLLSLLSAGGFGFPSANESIDFQCTSNGQQPFLLPA
jgi:hypothetical protein